MSVALSAECSTRANYRERILEPNIISLITFLLGLFLGHRLSLGRDKRKEFNDLTKDIYLALDFQIKNRGLAIVPINTIAIEPYFFILKRGCFREDVSRYKKANSGTNTYDPSTGQVTLNEQAIDDLMQHAKNILHYFYPR